MLHALCLLVDRYFELNLKSLRLPLFYLFVSPGEWNKFLGLELLYKMLMFHVSDRSKLLSSFVLHHNGSFVYSFARSRAGLFRVYPYDGWHPLYGCTVDVSANYENEQSLDFGSKTSVHVSRESVDKHGNRKVLLE